MKNVMTRAWELAKEAAVKFGGRANDYISQALKQAWAEAKSVNVNDVIYDAFEDIYSANDTVVSYKLWEIKNDDGTYKQRRVYINFKYTRNSGGKLNRSENYYVDVLCKKVGKNSKATVYSDAMFDVLAANFDAIVNKYAA